VSSAAAAITNVAGDLSAAALDINVAARAYANYQSNPGNAQESALNLSVISAMKSASAALADVNIILQDNQEAEIIAKQMNLPQAVAAIAVLVTDILQNYQPQVHKYGHADTATQTRVKGEFLSVASALGQLVADVAFPEEKLAVSAAIQAANVVGSAFSALSDETTVESIVIATEQVLGQELSGNYGPTVASANGAAFSDPSHGTPTISGPPAQYSGAGAPHGGGAAGTPVPGGTDDFAVSGTVVPSANGATFIMNGAILAESAPPNPTSGGTGSGGTGNTFIVPVASTKYGGGSGGLFGLGTIEATGSGNTVLIADGSSQQPLTTLTILQYLAPGVLDNTAPVAIGTTNTGNDFILVQDNSTVSDENIVTNNPENGATNKFELYILPPRSGDGPDTTFIQYGLLR